MRPEPHKAKTQRDGRAASLRCTGRRRASARKAARRLVLPYRRDMPARKRPTPEDSVTARRVLLDGLARDADIFELVSELAPLHPRDTPSPARRSSASRRTRWTGAGPAGPTRCPWRDYATGSCPSAPSAAGKTRSSSTRCWPQQPFTAGPNRTCLMRWPGGRPTTSGSTPCSRRSPTSALPLAGRASQCARHARTWASTRATRRHNDQFGTQRNRSSDGAAAEHIGGSVRDHRSQRT